MRRLIVSNILPGNSHTINVIVHQSRYFIFSRYHRCENQQVGTRLRIPQNNLFAPVAKDIGTQVGSGFGRIARSGIAIIGQSNHTIHFRTVPLVYLHPIQQFILQITVPIYSEFTEGRFLVAIIFPLQSYTFPLAVDHISNPR